MIKERLAIENQNSFSKNPKRKAIDSYKSKINTESIKFSVIMQLSIR